VRSTTDPMQAAAYLLRFVDETTSRIVQPGQGRRGEHGVITSGRVIPSVSEHEEMPPSSSRPHLDTPISDTTTTATSPRASPHPSAPVKRVIRRKMGVLTRTWMPKSISLGTEGRPEAFNRLLNEARFISKNPRPGCFMSPRVDDLFQWTAVLEGPEGTVYEGGTFFCNLHFTIFYPDMPPKVVFLTRIYHCNVSAEGEFPLSALIDWWESKMSICTVRSVLMSLFYRCNPDTPFVASISKKYRENRDEFNKTARIWTQRYAL
ncbi:hypothetical protein Angca_006415, partial [Angiostrongylus cantonensis]